MNEFVPRLEEAGLKISGRHPDRNLVETIELPEHPWFIGCQFHPEKSHKYGLNLIKNYILKS